MIPVMWFIVAVVMAPNGMVKVMSDPMATKDICESTRAQGDSLIASQGLAFESKCVMLGGTES
jgi:hypothetical protein